MGGGGREVGRGEEGERERYVPAVTFSITEEYQVRLFNMTNGADYQGRVQHYYDGGWNELCVEEDSDWTDSNSHVVCQQLGMGIPLWAAATVEPSHPIPRFISSDINCTGSEETVKDCKTQSWTMPSQCSGYVPWVSCEGWLCWAGLHVKVGHVGLG